MLSFPKPGSIFPISLPAAKEVSMRSGELGFSQVFSATWPCCGQALGLCQGAVAAGAVSWACACAGGGLSSCAQGWLFRVMPWWGADSKPLFLQRAACKKIVPMCKYPVEPYWSQCCPGAAWAACAGQEELTMLLFSQGAHIFGSLLQLQQVLQATPW